MSRDSDPWPKKPHIYILFLKLFTSPVQQCGGWAAHFVVPVPAPALGSGLEGTSIHSLRRLRHWGPGHTASREPSAATDPSSGRAWGSSGHSVVLSSSDPPVPAPGQAGTSGATRNGTSVPIKTHHYAKIHIEIWIDRLDKNGS